MDNKKVETDLEPISLRTTIILHANLKFIAWIIFDGLKTRICSKRSFKKYYNAHFEFKRKSNTFDIKSTIPNRNDIEMFQNGLENLIADFFSSYPSRIVTVEFMLII